MAGVVMDDGLKDWLTDLTTGTLFVAQKCRLYTNNHTPATSDGLGSYTEATFTGYAAVTVTGWSAPSVTGHVASTVSANVTFTLTAGTATIYGAYITNGGGTKLYGAQIDPNAPVTLNTTVTQYVVQITVSDQSA